MSDDRLFASNNAIGRKWYFLNIIILAVITVITRYVFNEFLIPNAKTDAYVLIAQGLMYFAYTIYLITFFALIDRRLFDIFGARDTKGYANVSAWLKLAVCLQALILIAQYFNIEPQGISLDFLQGIAWILNGIFLIITFIIGFIKGKISCLTFDQYKKQLKYK